MLRLRHWLLVGAALTATVALPSTAAADEPLSPISLGAVANRDFQAGSIGFGIGPYDDKLHLLFFGRAIVGPTLSAGMGGASGGYAFVERDHVHFGIDLGVSAGGGRYRGSGAGLLAAVEPGLFLRFLSDKAGIIHLDAKWYQPVYVRRDGVGGAAMLSIGWSPFYDR